jgi:cell division protein FtsB
LGWMFNLFLLTRLFFSDNGVIDYYQMAKILNDQQNDILKLEVENLAINKEISTIKTDRSYQKKLVRDHLGFIEQDEYLVIFAKETSN